MDNHRQRVCWLFWLGCLLWLAPVYAQAAAADLFAAEVAVSGQSPDERTTALRSALSEVLVRVAGRNSVLDSKPARAMLADPDALVQQYRYYTRQDSQLPQLLLWVRFDADSIRRRLQQQGQSFWGGERPDTLVWLAVEDRGRRYVVAADDDGEVRRQIESAARQRGLPVLFPLMDLEDQAGARFTDIWGGFFDNVVRASERYSPQAVLIGRLHRTASGGWSSRWQLQAGGGSPRAWSGSSQELAQLAQQGIADTADILASRFAVAGGSGATSGSVNIEIAGVDSLADYARVTAYLASLSSVLDLQVSQLDGPNLHCLLRLNGTLSDLNQTVAIGTVLEPLAGANPGSFRIRQ